MGAGSGGFTLITDHPACHVIHAAEIRLYSHGFSIENIDGSFLPVCISISSHVKAVRTIDIQDGYTHATKMSNIKNNSSNIDILSGILMIFELHNFQWDSQSCITADDMSSSGSQDNNEKKFITYNPFSRFAPNMSSVNFVAIMIPSTSRFGGSLSEATHAWKSTFRLHDIPDIKGGIGDLPKSILFGLLVALDSRSLTFSIDNNLREISNTDGPNSKPFYAAGAIHMPAAGYMPLRYVIDFMCIHSYI